MVNPSPESGTFVPFLEKLGTMLIQRASKGADTQKIIHITQN
jgi:hypothetical protein